MNALKFKPKAESQPYTPLVGVAAAFWDSMLAYYGDWTPNQLVTLANMAQDAGIIAACDVSLGGDLSGLELTRVDVRRDRAVKRFMRAARELNLDVAPADSRPARIAGRYNGRA
jgi:hypothetical protein